MTKVPLRVIDPEATELSRTTFACPSSVGSGGVCGGGKSMSAYGTHARMTKERTGTVPVPLDKARNIGSETCRTCAPELC